MTGHFLLDLRINLAEGVHILQFYQQCKSDYLLKSNKRNWSFKKKNFWNMIREAKLVRFDKRQRLHQNKEVFVNSSLLYKSLLPRMATLLCVLRVIWGVK